MGKHEIVLNLEPKSIDAAVRQIGVYKRDFNNRVDLLAEKVAEAIRAKAESGFNGAIVDDIISGSDITAKNIKVHVESKNKGVKVVVAQGEDVIWVEFGAGVYHNGSAGSSPNPYAADLGFKIGGFGKGKGKQNIWGFWDSGGENRKALLTHGAPAKMPLWKAVNEVVDTIDAIAKEVFR